MSESKYNPDVLSCLANLSNDEVFTPPNVVNNMLDMLPKELFENKETTFLDIGTKSGVFLREIAKRLIKGLESEIPDLQKRVDHILHKQLFGIATTELTSLVSRRTLYCSKYPNCRYSASKFDTVEGNIRFRAKKHDFVNGRCKWCGASATQFDRDDGLESHAYEFIHTDKPEEIFNMKFDVIVGNPPYQMNVGVEKENYAIAIYHRFVQQAKKLNPRYLTMIIPARWYAGGRGLDEFRDEMLHDRHIREIHDYVNPEECFPGVQIKGGVCYFLWCRETEGDCRIVAYRDGNIESESTRPLLEKGADTFIRHNKAITILRKVMACNEKSFSALVSPQTPFGIITSFKDFYDHYKQGCVKFYTNSKEGFVNMGNVMTKKEWVKEWKVLISAAYGAGEGYPHQIINKPFVVEPDSCCSQTYLVIGPFTTKEKCMNVVSYIKTRFFRFMVMLKKNAQHAMRGVYQFVPIQDFSKPWVDEELYKKYNLTVDEIKFIESMIKPME